MQNFLEINFQRGLSKLEAESFTISVKHLIPGYVCLTAPTGSKALLVLLCPLEVRRRLLDEDKLPTLT